MNVPIGLPEPNDEPPAPERPTSRGSSEQDSEEEEKKVGRGRNQPLPKRTLDFGLVQASIQCAQNNEVDNAGNVYRQFSFATGCVDEFELRTQALRGLPLWVRVFLHFETEYEQNIFTRYWEWLCTYSTHVSPELRRGMTREQFAQLYPVSMSFAFEDIAPPPTPQQPGGYYLLPLSPLHTLKLVQQPNKNLLLSRARIRMLRSQGPLIRTHMAIQVDYDVSRGAIGQRGIQLSLEQEAELLHLANQQSQFNYAVRAWVKKRR